MFKPYKITHGRRPGWSKFAATIDAAREIIRQENGGYMDDEPHFNESDAIELWNESAKGGCDTYAIENVKRYAIGTVDGGGNFQADTLGNDPEATHYATVADAMDSIKTLIEHGIDPDNPITDAAILDTTTRRIVWQQEGE